MAFRLNYNNSEYLSKAEIPLTAEPFSVSLWFNASNWATGGSLYNLFCLANTSVADQYWVMEIVRTLKKLRIAKKNSALGTAIAANAIDIEEPNTWHHACAIFASAGSRTAILDGDIANKATGTGSVLDFSATGTALGAQVLSSTSNYHHGDIAELAVYNVALDDGDVVRLAAGHSPLTVRPTKLVLYNPLIRTNHPRVGDIAFVHAKAAVVAAQPRMFYPFRRATAFPPPPAGGHCGRLIDPPLIKSKFELGLVA